MFANNASFWMMINTEINLWFENLPIKNGGQGLPGKYISHRFYIHPLKKLGRKTKTHLNWSNLPIISKQLHVFRACFRWWNSLILTILGGAPTSSHLGALLQQIRQLRVRRQTRRVCFWGICEFFRETKPHWNGATTLTASKLVYPLKSHESPLKSEHFSREYIWTNHRFSGDVR